MTSVQGGIATALFRLFPSLSNAPTLALEHPRPACRRRTLTQFVVRSRANLGSLLARFTDRPRFSGDHKPILHLITESILSFR